MEFSATMQAEAQSKSLNAWAQHSTKLKNKQYLGLMDIGHQADPLMTVIERITRNAAVMGGKPCIREQGALLTLDPSKARVRILPLG